MGLDPIFVEKKRQQLENYLLKLSRSPLPNVDQLRAFLDPTFTVLIFPTPSVLLLSDTSFLNIPTTAANWILTDTRLWKWIVFARSEVLYVFQWKWSEHFGININIYLVLFNLYWSRLIWILLTVTLRGKWRKKYGILRDGFLCLLKKKGVWLVFITFIFIFICSLIKWIG